MSSLARALSSASMQFQNKMACWSAMAEQLSNCSGPGAQRKEWAGLGWHLAISSPLSSASIFACPAHQAPKERFVWELGVGTAHGIAAQQKTLRLRAGKKAV
jgi:hypothetical protein